MQEDVVGPLHSLGTDYDTCSLCGRVYPARALSLREGEPAEGVRSEREAVCPECGRSLNMGEEPGFPLDDAAPDTEGGWVSGR